MEIVVDKFLCTSCGLCWNEFSSFFSYDKNMLVEVIQESVPVVFKDEIENIAMTCPGEAITIKF